MKFLNKLKLDKKTVLFLGIGIGTVIILIVVLVLINILSTAKLDFEKINKKLVSSAEKYLGNNRGLLPTEDGMEITVEVGTLVQEGYMKELVKYLSEDVTCNASVLVVNSNGHYALYPKLDCADDYRQALLYEQLTAEGNVVDSKDGLYSTDTGYLYRGDRVNNFVKFGGFMWQIVSIDENNDIKLIIKDTFKELSWDNRYNSVTDSSLGINDFNKSRIKVFLDNLYYNKSFTVADLEKIKFYEYCIGARTFSLGGKEMAEECALMSEKRAFGLPYVTDFLRVSLDTNCLGIGSESCQNYNYMGKYGRNWWTMTANARNTHQVYSGTSSLHMPRDAVNFNTPRAVVYINSNVIYSSGTGTFNDPYII